MSIRAFVTLLAACFVSNGTSRATSQVVYDCPLCGQKFATTNPDCSRCRFVAFGSTKQLTEAARTQLRAFVASDAYQKALDRPLAERVLLLYQKAQMPSFQKAGVYYSAIAYAFGNPEITPLLESTLSSLIAAESEPLSEFERQSRAILHIEVLRRLSRFDQAATMLATLRLAKSPLSQNFVSALEQEADRLEMKDASQHDWYSAPSKPTIRPLPIATKETTFGLPLNQSPKISARPEGKYPVRMRYAAISGEVAVAVSVSPDGTVIDAKALRATQTEFIDEAVKFARGCRFAINAQEKGRAFECTVAVVFELKDE